MKAEKDLWDVVVIGAGMGGSAFVSRFAESGLNVVVLERGEYLPTETANWNPEEVIQRGLYESDEMWESEGRLFHPRVYYNVGGNSKFFGGSAFRLRESDFEERRLPGGERTPPWPIAYHDLEAWYDIAEQAMGVHGKTGIDPTEPPRNSYPHPPLDHEPAIADLARRIQLEGLQPLPMPIAVHQGNGGTCRKGSPCDGFPCRIRAKGDGENAFLRPVLQKKDTGIEVHTGIRIDHLVHDEDGRNIVQAVGIGPGGPVSYAGKVFVVAAGAANSAKLLLRSRSPHHPKGLANSSGMVGRNFMSHNNSVLMAIRLFRRNPTRFQKTLTLNDFYHPGNTWDPTASGNIQMRGKIQPENLIRDPSILVRWLRKFISRHSWDFWVMSEDAPISENRIELLDNSQIRLVRKPTNMATHIALVKRLRRILRQCGFPIVVVRRPRLEAVQHQCGTLLFGTNPKNSVLNPHCRSWDVDNLYVCDASIMPSSAAVNPALTVAANALRVGDIVRNSLIPRQ